MYISMVRLIFRTAITGTHMHINNTWRLLTNYDCQTYHMALSQELSEVLY